MWEIQNGFNPIEYNASFTLTVSPLEVDETTPVAAGVVANFESGSDISLVVSPISSLDNALLSPNIPGYLGQAYDFLSNETIKSATITFNYDTAVGTIGDDFQPRIYYFNEETGTLEEVDNQVVSNGSVSAEVSHFSSYILLDKTDYAAVWNDEIKAPLISGNEGQASGIDVVFVIDVSGSMDEQGRLDTAKNAMSVFLDALDQHDRAALIKFTNTAQKLSDLTSDFALVKSYVSGLSANGGTSMYRGFGDALNLLTKANETYGYKMIVMLTDGYDDPATTFERQYADLVNKAISSDVAVYTIGVGQNVNTDMLTKIASDTAGGYHPANETDEITDAFEEIQSDTIDLKTDSNDDKIPDYFNDLIFKGELVIGNGSDEFKDVDFSKSADIDGDGLLNGEELVISVNGNQVYAQVLSNPLEADSDADGYTDYDEVNVYKSNPMKSNVSFNVKDLDYLATDSEYVSNKYLEFYENKWYGWLERGSVWIGNNVFGSNYDTTYLYKVILMEYLEQMVEEKQEANELRELYDQTREILSAMGDVVSEVAKNATKADLEKLKQLQEQLKTYSATLRATSHPGNFNTNIRPAIISIRENAWRDYTSATQQINALKGKTSLKVWQKVGKGAERVGLVLNVLDVATSIYDFYDTYAKFNAKLVGMADCVDTLEIIQKSNDAPNELKNACSELIRAIQNQSTKDWDTVKDALGLVGGKTARIVVTTTLIEKVAAANPKAGLILGAVILALSIEDFIFNVSEVSEKCTCLYAISKSSSIFATFFRSAVSSGDLNGEWRIVYDDGVQRTDDYFALAIMRKKSENQMKDADEANSFLLEWLFTKIMYKVSEIEENIGKIDALKMNYVAFTP